MLKEFTKEELNLIDSFRKLNDTGKAKASDKLADLAEIAAYTGINYEEEFRQLLADYDAEFATDEEHPLYTGEKAAALKKLVDNLDRWDANYLVWRVAYMIGREDGVKAVSK